MRSILLPPNPLSIAQGGTGQNNATDAFNALAPSQAGNSGEFLTTNGSAAAWSPLPMQKNMVFNGDMSLWQHNVSFTGSINGYPATDMFWQFISVATYSVSRASAGDLPGIRYCMAANRNAGSSNTDIRSMGYDFLTPDGAQLRGKTITISFYYAAGGNWSGGNSLSLTLFMGTGTDQSRRLVVLTGETSVGTGALTPSSSAWQRATLTVNVPATCNEATLYWQWQHSGTAGADDTLYFTGVQVEEGSCATLFEFLPDHLNLLACRRRFIKSFALDTTPAQNIGSASNCYRQTAVAAGAVVNRGPLLPFPVCMRAAPTMTSYNPSAANANARDTTGGVDCSAPAFVADANGFLMTNTGNAASAVGNSFSTHWTASAEI